MTDTSKTAAEVWLVSTRGQKLVSRVSTHPDRISAEHAAWRLSADDESVYAVFADGAVTAMFRRGADARIAARWR